MARLSLVILAAAVGLGVAFAADELKLGDGQELPKGMKLSDREGTPVDKVTKVSFAGFVVDVHTQTLIVDGEVKGDGWTFPHLAQLDEVQIPEITDKYLDFAFIAVPPTSVPKSAKAVKISGDHIFERRQDPSEGVRVWSQSNCVEITWAAERKEMTLEECRAAASSQVVP